jgi:hypothetical protein
MVAFVKVCQKEFGNSINVGFASSTVGRTVGAGVSGLDKVSTTAGVSVDTGLID